jgi:hypothetical protein
MDFTRFQLVAFMASPMHPNQLHLFTIEVTVHLYPQIAKYETVAETKDLRIRLNPVTGGLRQTKLDEQDE